ncbi:MAG: helix-turn-helix domain-containing protein [Myxococcales bacterium]
MRKVPTLNAKLAERLRQLRLDHGLTQLALAKQAKVSVDAVRRLERGAFSPTLRLLSQLAGALGMPTADVVALDEPTADRRVSGLVSLLKGRPEHDVAMVIRLARAALVDKD